MALQVAKERWGTVRFDDATGQVLVRENWLYRWRLAVGVRRPWTYAEKVATHRRLDLAVWHDWSNRFQLNVRARQGRAPSFGTRCPLSFDVRWVLTGGHWTVTMLKMPSNATSTTHISFVDLLNRTIELDTADFLEYTASNDAGVGRSGIRAIPHEFGHTLFNADEYRIRSPHLRDSDSLMNVGRQIRKRHLNLVVHTLNQLMPNLEFSA